MADVTNILFNSDDELNEEELINYLKGNLSGDALHEVEKKMADSAFTGDAVEGLQNFSSDKKLKQYVEHLNKNLNKNTNPKKQRKKIRKLNIERWLIISIIIILLVCVLAYIIIVWQKNSEQQLEKPAQQTTLLKIILNKSKDTGAEGFMHIENI